MPAVGKAVTVNTAALVLITAVEEVAEAATTAVVIMAMLMVAGVAAMV
jgi:hypothetical protein